jgi:hypothetical protein
MSYCRVSTADAYIYEHVGGFIECCGCSLINPEDGEIFAFYHANTAREMLSHIDQHIAKGDFIPQKAIDRIKEDHPDLDKQIEKYDANSR